MLRGEKVRVLLTLTSRLFLSDSLFMPPLSLYGASSFLPDKSLQYITAAWHWTSQSLGGTGHTMRLSP